MKEYIFAFFVGGTITVLIIYFEISGFPLLSRLAALFPIFTWLSYLFIGNLAGPKAVSEHALFVLLGTIVSWIPYMLTIYYFAPKIGSGKSIILALAFFVVFALGFIKIYYHA